MTEKLHLMSPEGIIQKRKDYLIKEAVSQQCYISRACDGHVLSELTDYKLRGLGFRAKHTRQIISANSWIEFGDEGKLYLVPKIEKKKFVVNEREHVEYLRNMALNRNCGFVKLEFKKFPCDEPLDVIDEIERFIFDIKHKKVGGDGRNRGFYDYQIAMATWSMDKRAEYYRLIFDDGLMDIPHKKITSDIVKP